MEKNRPVPAGMYDVLETASRQFRLLRIIPVQSSRDARPGPSIPTEAPQDDSIGSESHPDARDTNSSSSRLRSDVIDHDLRQPILECELATFSLDHPPEYKALSYCWTDAKAYLPINVNCEAFYIRPNLYEYLQQHNHTDGWIFVDAICINQDDLVEKASQVALMGDIYRRATEVIAWLGEVEAPQDPELVKLLSTGLKICAGLLTVSSDHIDLPDRAKAAVYDEAGNFTKLIHDVCSSSYWTRLWTIPELTLAQDLRLQCGQLRIDWKVLWLFSECWFASDFPAGPLIMTPDSSGYGTFSHKRMALDLLILRRSEKARFIRVKLLLDQKRLLQTAARAGTIPMSTAVTIFASQQCSMLHDKIYALLGMVRDPHITIDYTIPLAQHFADTLIAGMTEYLPATLETGPSVLSESDTDAVGDFTISCSRAFRREVHPWTLLIITAATFQCFGWALPRDYGISTTMTVLMGLGRLSSTSKVVKMVGKCAMLAQRYCTIAYLHALAKVNYALPVDDSVGARRVTYSAWRAYIEGAYALALKRRWDPVTAGNAESAAPLLRIQESGGTAKSDGTAKSAPFPRLLTVMLNGSEHAAGEDGEKSKGHRR